MSAHPKPTLAPITDVAMLRTSGYDRIEGENYATPAWCTEELLKADSFTRNEPIWDPACGEGAILRVAQSLLFRTRASDIIDRGWPHTEITNFLETPPPPYGPIQIVTNPPYLLAEAFIARAHAHIIRHGGRMAFLLRHEFDCAKSHRRFFADCPEFTQKWVLTKRPRWIVGSTGAPRHPFAWFVWQSGNRDPPEIGYLPTLI